MKWLGPVVVVAIAMLAEVTLGRVGHPPDFALFFGRFHPLVVHLPIGFFLLVGMGEAATLLPKLRDRVEPALGLLVPVSALAALGAFLMGQLLALEGGFPAGALGWHRRLTLIAIIGMAGCWVLFDRQRENGGRGRLAYRGVMGITLGVLSLGAHFGGTMTRGESYLSKYAPGPLKPLLGAPEVKKEPAKAPAKAAAAAAEPLVFESAVYPILNRYCESCHGPEKQKGKLRLDSLEAVLKGGENGPVVMAGDPKKSPLVARMLLPATDDDHMPPEGKQGPKPAELALIQFWIERGASPTLKVRDVLAPAESRALLEHTLGEKPPSDSVPVSAPAAPSATPAPSDAAAPAATPAPASDTAATPATPAQPSREPAGAAARAPATATSEAVAASAPVAAPAPTAGATSGPGFLAAHCEKCHGAQKQKGKLRVDSVAALVKGGANGAALVPGSPEQSAIVKRLRLALSDDDHMPPAKEPQPTSSEIASLVSWIRAGAGGGAARPAVASAGRGESGTGTGTGSGTGAGAGTGSGTGAGTGSGTGAGSGTGSEAAVAAGNVSEGKADAVAANVSAPAEVGGPPEAALLRSLPPGVALFAAGVQPLLREKCGKCHIRDKPAGGLSVDQQAQLLEGGYSGPGIVPKNRKASFVMQRLMLPPSDEEHMPPEGEPVLSADEVELVGSWIDNGAPARGTTETATLTAGAARALAARGVKGSGPEPLPAQAGGCAACSVPGAPQSKWLGLQAVALLGAVGVLGARRLARGA
jgi:uncharacterized membrane protein